MACMEWMRMCSTKAEVLKMTPKQEGREWAGCIQYLLSPYVKLVGREYFEFGQIIFAPALSAPLVICCFNRCVLSFVFCFPSVIFSSNKPPLIL